MSLWNN